MTIHHPQQSSMMMASVCASRVALRHVAMVACRLLLVIAPLVLHGTG